MENRKSRGLPEVMRDEMIVRDKIIELLKQEPITIPQIADKLGYSSREVVIWVMAMWRFGVVEEVGKPGAEGYYQYKLKE
jgi:predicted Rossmann fold nucleotide-binding protein DprA/Smf involved in DNA uptake